MLLRVNDHSLPSRRLDEATRLLRCGTEDDVRAVITALLVVGADEWRNDHRDLLVALAPLHWVARQLGANAVAVFDRAAATGPADLREVVATFGQRHDITPLAFGFAQIDEPEGPAIYATL